MAYETIITVKDVRIDARDDGVNTYQLVHLVSTQGDNYTGLASKFSSLPETGQTLKIFCQPVKQNGREQKTIIKAQEVDNIMATSKTTRTTKGTQGQSKFFTIKGTIFYAHVKEPNTKGAYPSNMYELNLSVSSQTKTALENLGVEVKNKGNELGDFVRIKSSFQPIVIDTEGNQLDTIPLIGNGSTGIITVSLYKNKATKGGSQCLGLSKIQLTNLIEFVPSSTPSLTDE